MSRINELVECAKSSSVEYAAYYDLFSDHAKVGEALIDRGAPVYINDKLEHLIEAIRARLGSRFNYIVGDAKEIIFRKDALVIAAGVGGLLLVECFQAWEKSHDPEVFNSLTFLLCPAYYDNELRVYLNKEKFKSQKEWICRERGRLYDMQLISQSRGVKEVGIISVPENKANYPEYIDKQLTSLSKIRVPSEVEKKLIFLYKTQKLS